VKYTSLAKPQERLLQITGMQPTTTVELLDKLQAAVLGVFDKEQSTSETMKLGIKTARTLLGATLDLRSMKEYHLNTDHGDGYKPAIIFVPVTKGAAPEESRAAILSVGAILYY
jgi:hypothetical protein